MPSIIQKDFIRLYPESQEKKKKNSLKWQGAGR
jgi:hypothetical protein